MNHFLTEEMARKAFETFVLPGIVYAMKYDNIPQRFHVVVLKPRVPFVAHADLPILFEESIEGEVGKNDDEGGGDVKMGALLMARLAWRTGISSKEVVLEKSQSLENWGGVVYQGIVASVNGAQPLLNDTFAMMTAVAVVYVANSHANQVAHRGECS